MENQSPSTPSTKPCLSLPPEIILKILNMAIETPRCLVRELSNVYHCEGFQEETTVIYTRGHPDEKGRFSRGQIEYLPVQHRCIYDAPVADQVPRNLLRDDSWDNEIWRHHIRTCLQVFERKWRPDAVHELIVDGIAGGPVPLLEVTESDIFERIPFQRSVLFGNKLDANSRPYTAILKPEDPLLECAHMRHLMIKGRWGTTDDDIYKNVLKDTNFGLDSAKMFLVARAIETNLRFHVEHALLVDWSMMVNLETLFLDLTSVEHHYRLDEQAKLFREMGKHLNLKTFVVAGLFVEMDVEWVLFDDPDSGAHEDMSNEELTRIWVGMLEDRPMIDSFRNCIYFFKECLRPGGQLHLIFEAEVGTFRWPLPTYEIEALDSDLESVDVESD
ncbi:hypothetical protein QQX98_005837 [Neonectria punicea]|uniref:F-box domain-containing protein n=1 Tax=Neonectria punicea TaxID=979145 RepID=A0ABR1H355_9HYPO